MVRSVNWEPGMFLTPDHFLRQEAYADALAVWALRYTSAAVGLVGGGPRTLPDQNLDGKFNPQLAVDTMDDGISVAVTRARGITPSGRIVDIDEPAGLLAAKDDVSIAALGDAAECFVAVVHSGEKEVDPGSNGADAAPANRPRYAYRRPGYRVRLLRRADEIHHALVLARLAKVESGVWTRDESFVPLCATMLAHSVLANAGARLRHDISTRAVEYTDLHNVVAEYINKLERKYARPQLDRDIHEFLERAAIALHTCRYEMPDPASPPHHIFRQIDRMKRHVVLALDLLADNQDFKQLIPRVGKQEGVFGPLEPLSTTFGVDPRQNMNDLVQRATGAVTDLEELYTDLSEVYQDYRVNRMLSSLRYLLDTESKDGDVYERTDFAEAAVMGAPASQRGDTRRFELSSTAAPGPGNYVIALVGSRTGESALRGPVNFQVRTTISMPGSTDRIIREKTIGSGYRDPTDEKKVQRNIKVPVDMPEMATASNLTVEVSPLGHWFQHAVLFNRVEETSGFAPPPIDDRRKSQDTSGSKPRRPEFVGPDTSDVAKKQAPRR